MYPKRDRHQKTQIVIRTTQDVIAIVDERSRAEGMTKAAWIEAAIRAQAGRHAPETDAQALRRIAKKLEQNAPQASHPTPPDATQPDPPAPSPAPIRRSFLATKRAQNENVT